MRRVITIFEHDYVGLEGSGLPAEICLPKRDFEHLKLIALREGEDKLLNLKSYRGTIAVQATKFVGGIPTPSGNFVEILPKHQKFGKNIEESRNFLLKLVAEVGEGSFRFAGDAKVSASSIPFQEVFIRRFLVEAQRIVSRGLAKKYIRDTHVKNRIKGKLLVSKQVKKFPFRGDKFFVQYDVFTIDRAENRLLKYCILKLMSISRSSKNRALCKELLFVFSEISESESPFADLSAWERSRVVSHYDHARNLVVLILRGLTPTTTAGGWVGDALLFSMQGLFEKIVQKYLMKYSRADVDVISQASRRSLVIYNSKNWFRLKPDILLCDFQGDVLSIFDAKWKVLDSGADSNSQKYNIDQNDMYQMFAYGNTYLEGIGDMLLIYPLQDDFKVPLGPFRFSESLAVWATPFNLETMELVLPDALQTTVGGYFNTGFIAGPVEPQLIVKI
jgi:5-methylcytosine-specific restriction enzyme subunit McrC